MWMVLRPMWVYVDGDIKILYIVYAFFYLLLFSSIPAKKKNEVCILKTLHPSKHTKHTQKKEKKRKKEGIYFDNTLFNRE